MRRRHLLTAWTPLIAGSWSALPTGTLAQGTPDLAALISPGGCVVLLRHAQTEPGIGDPPNFRVEQCSTQRNLSADGRAQARRIGQWFTDRKLRASAVRTSPWCRCKDTADIAFGNYTVLQALGSTFDNRSAEAGQTQTLRALLQNVPKGQFEVWVSHQVNITALTGEVPAMGEALLVDRFGKMLARTRFE
jgi:phosphohistidine phosphatase SixA